MGLHIPRRYLDLPELVQRLSCTDKDVRALIVDGILRVSLMVADDLRAVAFVESGGKFRPVEARVDDRPIIQRLAGYYTLEAPIERRALECDFSFISDAANPEQTGVSWWLLNAPVSLSEIWAECVVMMPEVLRVEALLRRNVADLKPKERAKAAQIIFGLALTSYGYDPEKARNEAPRQIVDDLATRGISVDVDTVRKWIKIGADLHEPQEAPAEAERD